MSLYGLSGSNGLSGSLRIALALFVAGMLSGCGVGGGGGFTDNANLSERSHNKLATKILADIAVSRVRGKMPARVASRRGRETL